MSSNFIDHGADDSSLEDPRLEKLWHKVPSAGREPWPGVLPGAASLTLRALPRPASLQPRACPTWSACCCEQELTTRVYRAPHGAWGPEPQASQASSSTCA